MCVPPWRERREAYLRDRGRWADLIREGYVEHALTLVDGGRCRREREQSPALFVIADTAPTCEAEKRKGEEARDPGRPPGERAGTLRAGSAAINR